MLERISSKELTEWQAFDALEPIGEMRADYRTGLLCSVLGSIHCRKAKRFKPSDFMPFMEQQRAPMQSPEQAFKQLFAIARKRKPKPKKEA